MSQESAQIAFGHLGTFLLGLAARDSVVLDALDRAHCPVVDSSATPSLTFSLSALFDALCISSQASGIVPPAKDWQGTFQKFCRLFMFSWPDATIAAAGYSVKIVHRSNSYAASRYELLPHNQSSKRTREKPRAT